MLKNWAQMNSQQVEKNAQLCFHKPVIGNYQVTKFFDTMAKYMFFDYIVVMVTNVAKPELFFALDTVSGFSAPFTVSNELYNY